MKTLRRGYLAVLAALALAACTGDKGAQGPQGPAGDQGSTGAPGTPGDSGISTGSISGSATYSPDGTTVLNATNVTVETIPASVTTTTAADGTFALAGVPVGIYQVKLSGNGFSTVVVANVSVVAGGTAKVPAQTLVATNPLVVTSAASLAPIGFGKAGQLDVKVAGGSGNYTYKWTALKACDATTIASCNPTAVTLSDAAAKAPTFTSGKLSDVAAASNVVTAGFVPPTTRDQFMPVSMVQATTFSYSFTVTVTDTTSKFQKALTIAIPTLTISGGQQNVPVGSVVVASYKADQAAAPAFTAPAGSAAALNADPTSKKLFWFVADKAGTFTVAGLPALTAANYVGSDFGSSFSVNALCTGCHTRPEVAPAALASANAKFKAWSNSAHGNHFFKYMVDTAGPGAYPSLAYKPSSDAVWAGKYGKLPTANYGVFWDIKDLAAEPMTTFEFGMTGAEGSHYSASCTGCHLTGYNTAIGSAGADEAIAAAGGFPNLSVFKLTGPTTDAAGKAVDQVTAAPDWTFWNGSKAFPDSVKRFAGMQCEACHGPLGQHADPASQSGAAPQPEYGVAACAICHDRATQSLTQVGGSHDRVALWRNSKHANLGVASSHGLEANCTDCHSAQGFAAMVSATEGNATVDVSGASTAIPAGLTAANVQPQTCAACHDAHSTEVRITGEKPVALKAGFTVAGAGTGALCMACHNSRRAYVHNDATPFTGSATPHENGAANQADVLMGMNAFFVNPNVSKHALVEDTCVGCHMKLHAATLNGKTLAPGTTNHTMVVDGAICKSCHGAGVTIDGIEAAYDAARADAIGQLGATLLAAVDADASFTDGATTPKTVKKADVASIGLSGSSVVFTKTDKTTVSISAASLKSIAAATEANPTPAPVALVKAQASSDFQKAIWNLALTNDNSSGIHNPTWIFDVLAATKAKLAAEKPVAACAAACL